MDASKKLVLIVEDDPLDQFLIRNAFEAVGLESELAFASDGEAALDVLEAGLDPCVVVTDLRMPGLDGFGFLAELRKDDRLRRIPTVVFSTSSENEDILKAYDRCANSYIVKPHSASGYQQFADRLRQYWIEENRLPI